MFAAAAIIAVPLSNEAEKLFDPPMTPQQNTTLGFEETVNGDDLNINRLSVPTH